MAQYLIIFINIFFEILYWFILAYILMSWFITRPNAVFLFLKQVVDPLLKYFRWARIGMIDLSPIVALLILGYGRQILVNALSYYFL